MPITTLSITSFHAKRQNYGWPSNPDEQEAALARALDYQRAFYPVREILTPSEEATFNSAIALLALEMVPGLAVRATQNVKKLKEASSTGSSIETEYEDAPTDPFPLITAMLAPLTPAGASQSAVVRFARMRP